MTDLFTEAEALAVVPNLTLTLLAGLLQENIVQPVLTPHGPRFRRIDLARLELLCELTNGFDMNHDSAGLLMDLLDQLHALRSDLRALYAALTVQPPEVQSRIAETLGITRFGAV
jgi:chaperone modulatory protein CbpM